VAGSGIRFDPKAFASERAQKRCGPFGELHLSRYDLLRGRAITNGNGDNRAATSSAGAANKLGSRSRLQGQAWRLSPSTA
jgi:hypothetical protein